MTEYKWHPAFAAILVVVVVIAICLMGPWWLAYELDSDEGLNLQKAVLLTEGHKLYTEIWNDQPPVLTWILAGVQKSFPYSLVAARTTILMFGLLLLIVFYRLVERYHGSGAALVAGFLLFSTEIFPKLSVSVMIGLPAIALAALAMLLTTGRRSDSVWWNIAGGMVFALAVFTKMFVLIMLPPILLAIWMDCPEDKYDRWNRFLRAWITFLSGAVAASLVLVLSLAAAFDQLITPHVSARSLEWFDSHGGPSKFFDFVADKAALPYHFALLFGLLALLHRPFGHLLIPVIWLATGVIVLLDHSPLWPHHILIVAVPLCWLGGVGATSILKTGERLGLIDRVMQGNNRWAKRSLVGLLLLLAAGAVFEIVATARETYADARGNFREPARLNEQLVKLRLQLFDTDTSNTVVADLPIDAYHLRKTVPPKLAVWSRKRWETGNLSEEEIITAIRSNPGSQVLVRRFVLSPELIEAIARDRAPVRAFTDEFSGGPLQHFVTDPTGSMRNPSTLEPLREALRVPSLGRPGTKDISSGAGLTAAGIGLESALHLGHCFLEASVAEEDPQLLIDAVTMAQAISYQARKGGWFEGTSLNSGAFEEPAIRDIIFLFERLIERLDYLDIDRPDFLESIRSGEISEKTDSSRTAIEGNSSRLPNLDCSVETLLGIFGTYSEASGQ